VSLSLLQGDCRAILPTLPAESVQCVVTSPPYFGLRDYGHADQIGLEATPEEYVETMVGVFREVRRVLRPDGTLWLNLGDSYASKPPGCNGYKDGRANREERRSAGVPPGLKPKDLVGIPWRVAFALQADGWYLRSDIIWSKPNPMPESVKDRPTKAHEYVFLLTKSARYFFDADAVREEAAPRSAERYRYDFSGTKGADGVNDRRTVPEGQREFNGSRNIRTVWTIPTQPYSGAHFATFPRALVEPCLKAGTSEKGACSVCGAPWARVVEREVHTTGRGRDHIAGGDVEAGQGWEGVPRASIATKTTGWSPSCCCFCAPGNGSTVPCVTMDPFYGSGTVGLVAQDMHLDCIGIELSEDYAKLARKRTEQGTLPFGVTP
jgi:DNA modification methylase